MNKLLLQPDPRRKRLVVVPTTPTPFACEIVGTGTHAESQGDRLAIPFPDFVPWAPGRPHLYTLDCRIGDETFELPFGMREVSVNEQRICINQRPIVLKGLRFYSSTHASQLDALVAAGFNWLAATPENIEEATLTNASNLGLMVTLDLANLTAVAPATEIVHRFANFTSVIAWDCATDEIAAAIRDIDPTRPVFTPANVLRPYQSNADHVARFVTRVLTPITRETEALLGRAGHARALNLATVRGLAAPTHSTDISKLADATALEAHATGAIRATVDSLRSNPRLAGYCFEDALERGDPKSRLAAFTDAQAPVRPVITMTRSNLVPREELDVAVTLLNEARLEGRAELSLQVVGPTNQVLWKKKRGVKVPKHGKELWTGTVAASGSVGTHHFVVRVLDERGAILGQSGVSFHVSPPVERWNAPIDVLDPTGRWLDAIKRLAPQIEATAPVILIPPLAASIRAWPDNPFGQTLGRIREGAVGIVIDPPDDWADLGATLSTPIDPQLASLFDRAPAGSIGVTRLHPWFEGLPAGSPLARPYRGLLSAHVLQGETEEDIAPVAAWNGDTNFAHRVLVRRFGNGRLVFTTLSFLDRLGADPVVDRLFVNLLRHSERRAIDTKEIAKVEPRAIEWLRQERASLRVWRLIGPFANWDGEGHDTAYPPESGYDSDATYAGWYRAAAWKTWHQHANHPDELALSDLLRPDMIDLNPYPGTFYAYTDLTSEDRVETRLTLHHTGQAKCWLNARPLDLTTAPSATHPGADVVLKQGRNALLIKLSTTQSPATFTLRLASTNGLRWL